MSSSRETPAISAERAAFESQLLHHIEAGEAKEFLTATRQEGDQTLTFKTILNSTFFAHIFTPIPLEKSPTERNNIWNGRDKIFHHMIVEIFERLRSEAKNMRTTATLYLKTLTREGALEETITQETEKAESDCDDKTLQHAQSLWKSISHKLPETKEGDKLLNIIALHGRHKMLKIALWLGNAVKEMIIQPHHRTDSLLYSETAIHACNDIAQIHNPDTNPDNGHAKILQLLEEHLPAPTLTLPKGTSITPERAATAIARYKDKPIAPPATACPNTPEAIKADLEVAKALEAAAAETKRHDEFFHKRRLNPPSPLPTDPTTLLSALRRRSIFIADSAAAAAAPGATEEGFCVPPASWTDMIRITPHDPTIAAATATAQTASAADTQSEQNKRHRTDFSPFGK